MKKVIGERKINSSLAQLQKLDLPRERRRRINRKIVICLAAGQARAFAKLKTMARRETSQEIIEDFTHSTSSFMGKLKDTIENMIDFLKLKYDKFFCTCSTGEGCCGRCSYQVECCTPGPKPTKDSWGSYLFRTLRTTLSYVDFVRDAVLVGLLVIITKFEFFSDDITLFPNVVILLLLGTVTVPTFISAIQTSTRHPLTVFEFSVWNNFRTNPPGWWKMVFIRLAVFFCYILVPSILINNKEKAKLKRQQLEEKGKEEFESREGIVPNEILEEQEHIEAYLDDVRKSYLIFKRNEAALELVVQQSIQLTMLLLSRTKYPVASGLQRIFKSDSGDADADVMLMLSVCWSFKTCVSSFLKIHSEQKARMLSWVSKLVLAIRALLFSVTRIGCVVAFFGPFLGLGDCMAHWHAEGIQLDPEILENLRSSTGSVQYWDRKTVDLMYREQLDPPTNYTLVTLQAAFFIFLGVLLLHGIAILILKMSVSIHFQSTSWLNKLGHVVESLHVPDVYKDFDVDMNPEEERSPEDYRKSYNSVLKETLWMSSLQTVSNLLLLVPLLVTGESKERI